MRARSYSTGLVVAVLLITNARAASFFNNAPLVALFALTARSEATAQPSMEPTQCSVCPDESVFSKCPGFGSVLFLIGPSLLRVLVAC